MGDLIERKKEERRKKCEWRGCGMSGSSEDEE